TDQLELTWGNYGAINQMITLRKMKLLPWDEPKIDKILKKYGYLKRRLKKGRYYFIKKDLPVLAEANIFIIRADLPDDLVYSIAEAIATSAPRIRQSARLFRRFDPKKLWKDVGGPLHPGAEKYYRAAGLMP
ncbi:MAG: TAXI family TRAP transporter solute-binding subunit, partial [Nitrospinota bacterium]